MYRLSSLVTEHDARKAGAEVVKQVRQLLYLHVHNYSIIRHVRPYETKWGRKLEYLGYYFIVSAFNHERNQRSEIKIVVGILLVKMCFFLLKKLWYFVCKIVVFC